MADYDENTVVVGLVLVLILYLLWNRSKSGCGCGREGYRRSPPGYRAGIYPRRDVRHIWGLDQPLLDNLPPVNRSMPVPTQHSWDAKKAGEGQIQPYWAQVQSGHGTTYPQSALPKGQW
jgi:hypothetical protein